MTGKVEGREGVVMQLCVGRRPRRVARERAEIRGLSVDGPSMMN